MTIEPSQQPGDCGDPGGLPSDGTADLPTDGTANLPVGGTADLPADGTADLIGYGRVSWSELTRMLGGAQTAWAGYDGFHIGQAPSAPPPYSHLWAWTGQWLIRARIEGDQAIVGALILNAAPEGASPPKATDKVRYERVAARTWPQGEQRVGPLEAEIADRRVDIFLISGERPVTFVSVAPAT